MRKTKSGESHGKLDKVLQNNWYTANYIMFLVAVDIEFFKIQLQ